MKMKKKGAIEMSMQTIIVVVIGVTLLTLGLRFVYTTFTGVGGQQEKISALTETQLGELFGESEEPIFLTADQVAIKKGTSETIDVAVRNTGETQGTFKYVIKMDSAPAGVTEANVLKWMTWSKNGRSLASGNGYKDKLLVNVPKTAIIGIYMFTLELTGCGPVCESQPYAQLVLEIKA